MASLRSSFICLALFALGAVQVGFVDCYVLPVPDYYNPYMGNNFWCNMGYNLGYNYCGVQQDCQYSGCYGAAQQPPIVVPQQPVVSPCGGGCQQGCGYPGCGQATQPIIAPVQTGCSSGGCY